MTTPTAPRTRSRGPLVVALVVALAGVVAVATPGVGEQVDALRARITAECRVDTGAAQVPLSLDQAQRATTAAARDDLDSVDDVDPAVLDRLAAGPPEDAGPVLTCRVEQDRDLPVEEVGDDGLTPRAQRVLEEVTAVFGSLPVGGFAPGGVDSGHGAESTHYEGRAVDVFYRPVSEENRRQGWLLAHWLVAHAGELDVQYVIWDDRYWGVRGSGRGWRDYEAPPPGGEVLRHLDHVHVDVLRGG